MTEKTLEQLTTVNLEKSLDIDEFQLLLLHISKTLPANVSYNVSFFKSYFYNPEFPDSLPEVQQGSVSVNGTINSLKVPMAFDTFGIVLDKDYTRIKAIRFNRIPGYDSPQDYREEVVSLWESVAKTVKDYRK
jgi:hypothetical protein